MNDDKILNPKILPEVIKARNGKRLAIFIGAGVSRLIGCDSWELLAHNLLRACYENNVINYREQETLSNIKDNKKLITVCYNLLKSNHYEVFKKQMKNSLKEEKEQKASIPCPNIYDSIRVLGNLFITTNADTHFDRCFHSDDIILSPDECTIGKLSEIESYGREAVFHIHGSFNDFENLVFTVDKYLDTYSNIEFQKFLIKIFKDYNILFIGYGLNEFELLEILIRKNLEDNVTKHIYKWGRDHYLLMPFYSDEDRIFLCENDYYSSYGINVVSYFKDKKGYQQLVDVLKEWNEDTIRETDEVSEELNEIDIALEEEMSKDSFQKVIKLIRKRDSNKAHFFLKLAQASQPLEWLIPLYEEGYFAPENNPEPVRQSDTENYHTPVWRTLIALVNIAEKNKETPNNDMSPRLLEIVDDIIQYRKNGQRVNNVFTDRMLLEVLSRLPIDYIQIKHINFIRDALENNTEITQIDNTINVSLLPVIIKHRKEELLVKLLDIILDYKVRSIGVVNEYNSILNSVYIEDVLKKHKDGIAVLCPIRAAKITIRKIEEIKLKDNRSFSYYTVKPLDYINEEPAYYPYYGYEHLIVHFIIDMLNANIDDSIATVKALLLSKHDILRRIAYYQINCNFKILSSLLWELTHNPLDEYSREELYDLFEAHQRDFTEQQLETIIQWIESQKISIPEKITTEPDREKFRAKYRRDWLSSLKDGGNDIVKRLYEKYKAMNDQPVFYESSASDFTDASEIEIIRKKGEISQLLHSVVNNEQLASIMIDYKEENRIYKDGYGKTYFTEILEMDAENHPSKYLDKFTPFYSVPREYQCYILRGLFDGLMKRKHNRLNILLDISLSIIKQESLWENSEQENNYHRKIAYIITEAILFILAPANYQWSNNEFSKIKDTILILLEKVKGRCSTIEEAMRDSLKGNLVGAAIEASRFPSVFIKTEEHKKWVVNLLSHFTKYIDQSIKDGLEFYVALGRYLPILISIDNEWVDRNFDKIINSNNEIWEATMNGYLINSSPINEKTYQLLKSKGCYTKALGTSFYDVRSEGKIIQQIVLGYLHGWESLDSPDSLLQMLVNSNNADYLNKIVLFVSQRRFSENATNKIKPLWRAIFEKSRDLRDKENYRIILSNLTKWGNLINTIDDDSFEWLKISIECFKEYWKLSDMVELFRKHVKATPEKVGKLYIKLLDSGMYPTYKENHIKEIIEALYEAGEKYNADKICRSYMGQGITFLREVYEKYQK